MGLTSKKIKILKLLFISNLIFAFLYWILCNDDYHFNGDLDKKDETQFGKFFNRFYYSINVTSTLGMTNSPASKTCKFLVMIQICLIVIEVFYFTKDITM